MSIQELHPPISTLLHKNLKKNFIMGYKNMYISFIP